MNIEKTLFEDLLIINLESYTDKRGVFRQLYRKDQFKEIFPSINFCQDNESVSNFGVLRGLHFQRDPFGQAKLVRVVKGEILDVVVDLRKKSATFTKYFKIRLSEFNQKQLFIPKGFAHGFLSLSDNTVVNYKVDNYYKPTYEEGLIWNDPFLNIDWELDHKNIIISEKDSRLPIFNNIKL